MEQARVFELETMERETNRQIKKLKYQIESLEVNRLVKKYNVSSDERSGIILRMGTIEHLCEMYNCKVSVERRENVDVIDILLDTPNKKIVIYVSSDPAKEIAELIAKKRNLTMTS